MAKKRPAKHEKNGQAETPEADATEREEPTIDDVRGELNRLKDRWAKVTSLEADVSEAAMEMDSRKRELKEAKDTYEALVSQLRNAIRRAESPQQELPFPEGEEEQDWQAVTLEELDITGKLAENLTEAGIKTLGDIAAHTESGKLLTDIKGVGDKAVEKIEAATQKWWEDHPAVDEPSEDDSRPDLFEAAGVEE